MPLRLKIAIGASLLFHLALLLVFWALSLEFYPKATLLSSAGGVVWWNLNPGGEGTGGAGGLGGPAEPGGTQPPAKLSASEPPAKKFLEKLRILKKPPSPKPDATLAMKAPEPDLLRPPSPPVPLSSPSPQSSSWKGPGEGDEAGTKTGPGGGAATGAGDGKGTGGGTGAGPGGVGAPGTGGGGTGGAGSKILIQIRNKILNAKRYPRRAREDGVEGISGLIFEINSDGSLKGVRLVSSSGSPQLDEEALATVRRAAPFPYYPSPIRFTLRFSLKDED